MKTNLAKAALYVLIGSTCVYALLWIGQFVRSFTGDPSFGFILDGLLGLLLIAIVLWGLALILWLGYALFAVVYVFGEWIMEKLL